MAYKITSACVSCGSCADVCPAGAISQGDDQYVIDSAACLARGLGDVYKRQILPLAWTAVLAATPAPTAPSSPRNNS